MLPFEILLLAGVAGQNTIFFLPFLPSKQCFCVRFTLPRPKRRAQGRSKIITTPEKRQFIHVFKELKQGLKVQDKDDFLASCVK